jgi:thioester reductase-like protein
VAAKQRTIVLTGASGVVGQALLRELGEERLICLTHRQPVSIANGESIRCDVTQPQLGLARAEYADLARRADCVIHGAAVTDWDQPNERLRNVNVEGTLNVLQLARDADVPLYHMSTSFIRAIADDAPLELDDSHIIVNYVTSKRDTEQLVAESGVPATILRPTNLIGDSRTGEIASSQVVQLVAEFVCRGKVPYYPTRPGTLVDVVPQDLFAQAVRAIVQAEDIGQEYWLTYGDEAMTVDEAMELCVEFMARIGQPIAPPRPVDAENLDAVRDEIESLSPMTRAIFNRLLELAHGLAACGVFPSSLRELQARYDLPDPSCREAYVRGLEYLTASKGLWNPAAA